MSHTVVKELKTDTKLCTGIYLQDFFFIVAYTILVTFFFSALVTRQLTWLFAGFNLAVSIFLSRPSGHNPGKRKYQELIFYLRREDAGYHAL